MQPTSYRFLTRRPARLLAGFAFGIAIGCQNVSTSPANGPSLTDRPLPAASGSTSAAQPTPTNSFPAIAPDPAKAAPYAVNEARPLMRDAAIRIPVWIDRPDGDSLGLWMDDGKRTTSTPVTAGLYGIRFNAADMIAADPVLIAETSGTTAQGVWNPVTKTFWATWTATTRNAPSTVQLAQVTPEGGLQGSVQTVASNSGVSRLTVDPQTGTVAIAWSDQRQRGAVGADDIYARLYAADGSPKGAEVAVCLDPGVQFPSAVMTAADGTFGVTWFAGGGLSMQGIDGQGKLLAKSQVSGMGTTTDTFTMAIGGPGAPARYVLWPSGDAFGRAVWGQRYSDPLQPVGDPMAMTSGTGKPSFEGVYQDPQTGMIVLYWNDAPVPTRSVSSNPVGGNLVIQRLAATGRQIGPPVTLMSGDADPGLFTNSPRVSLVPDHTGRVLAFWNSFGAHVTKSQLFVVPQ